MQAKTGFTTKLGFKKEKNPLQINEYDTEVEHTICATIIK